MLEKNIQIKTKFLMVLKSIMHAQLTLVMEQLCILRMSWIGVMKKMQTLHIQYRTR